MGLPAAVVWDGSVVPTTLVCERILPPWLPPHAVLACNCPPHLLLRREHPAPWVAQAEASRDCCPTETCSSYSPACIPGRPAQEASAPYRPISCVHRVEPAPEQSEQPRSYAWSTVQC